MKSPEKVFEEQYPFVSRLARVTARSKGFSLQDAEDFEQHVMVHLMQDDYRVLRKFEDRSSLRTFLTTVVKRQALDYCDRLWRRWRPSTKAAQLGPVAIQLELLLSRDGLLLEEAVSTLLSRGDFAETREELEELAAQLPVRIAREFVSYDLVPEIGSEDGVESRLTDRECRRLLDRVQEALNAGLEALEQEDALLLGLLHQGLTIAEVARRLDWDQRRLYPRRDRARARIRKEFAERELEWEEVKRLLGWDYFDALVFDPDDDPEEPN